MPKHLTARPPLDADEERHVRKLVHSVHAPADWIVHAMMIARSWAGLRTRQIADELGCHPETVRHRLHAFNDRGLDGVGMLPGSGRKPRLTQLERSLILALVKLPPPGKPTAALTGERAAPDPDAEPEWTLDTLPSAARERGSQVARRQVRRIFVRAGVRWRRTRLWARRTDPDFAPKGRASSRSTPPPPEGATVVCVDELGPVTPRNFPPAPGWSPDGHRLKVPVDYDRGLDKGWVDGALCVRDGQVLTQTAPARHTAGSLARLTSRDQADAQGDLSLLADTLSSHTSGPIRDCLAAHPRVQHAFIPSGAAWLTLIAGWWRLFRRKAFAGVSLADAEDFASATHIATAQLNRHAQPWIWGRPPPPPRTLRRCFVYRL